MAKATTHEEGRLLKSDIMSVIGNIKKKLNKEAEQDLEQY